MSWMRFWRRYASGDIPWDSGIVPPEIVRLIEADGLPPGQALDIGCGTGTTSIYLAQKGWHALGLDFVPRAVRMARTKASEAGVLERLRFETVDIRKASFRRRRGAYDLLIDIGCGHVLPPEEWRRYAATLARLSKPGATLMIYVHLPSPERPGRLEADFIEQELGQWFSLEWREFSEDTGSGQPSAWFRFQKRV